MANYYSGDRSDVGAGGSGWAPTHHGSVSEYQGSCLPFVTSSLCSTAVQLIEFPRVTRFIVLRNNHATQTLSFGFTQNGLNGAETENFFTLTGKTETGRLEIKCDKLWIKASGAATNFSLIAGITNIAKGSFLNLTGSEGFDGVG
jgi:hypothetical protein